MKKCNNCNSLQHKELYKFDYRRELFYGEKRASVSVYRCLSCKLIWLDFNSDRENREEIHDFWWEQTWLDTYSWFKEKIDRNYIEKLKFFENKTQGKRILDVGCGCGFFLSMAKKEGWDAIGVDISQQAINYAKSVLGLEVLHSTVSEVDFPDEHFDLITMWDVIEHLDKPSEVLNELRRILKPKGLLVIETPNARSLIHLIAHISYKLRYKGFIEKIYPLGHLFYFSKQTLADMLSQNGFICEKGKAPIKALFDDLDIIFMANKSKEKWARSKAFKHLINLGMKFSEMINMPYRLRIVARKKNEQ